MTKKQKEFVKDYLETGNATKAALKTYETTDINTAASIGSENLTKPKIRQYLESKADRAGEIIYELAENAENETVRLNASKDILDRTGFKAQEEQVIKSTGNTYNFLFSAETQQEIKKIEETIKQRLINGNNKED